VKRVRSVVRTCSLGVWDFGNGMQGYSNVDCLKMDATAYQPYGVNRASCDRGL
jgi:hypothetical protein